MNKWIGIEEFIATINTGSLSQAAIKLSTSKSNISKKIAQLETRLSTKLVYRHKQRIALTAIGQIYYKQAIKLLDDLHQADTSISNEQNLMIGDIKLLVPPGITEALLVNLIHDFRQEYPQVTFSFVSSVSQMSLIDSQADLAFRYSPAIDDHLIARPLFNNRYRLCASPDFFQTHGLPEHPNELTQLNCLNYCSDLNQSARQWGFQHHSQTEKTMITPNIITQSDSVNSLVQLCLLGSGILYCSHFFVRHALKNGQLVSILDDWILDNNQLWLVYLDRQALSKRVKIFIEYTVSRTHLMGT